MPQKNLKLFKPHQIGEIEKLHLPDIEIRKINNEIVKAVPIELDTRPVKGHEVDAGDDPYSNILMVASTASGKTTALFHLLKKIVGKATILIFFVSTIYNDKTWIEIVKHFEKKGNPVVTFMGIKEDGHNHLRDLIEDLQSQAEAKLHEQEEDNEEPDAITRLYNLHGHREPKEKPKKEKKSKYQSAKYIIVFDDMAGETNNAEFANVLKKLRHFEAKAIISTQYCKDVLPMGLLQIRQWMLFRGIDPDKLHHCYEAMSNRADVVPEDLFIQFYNKAVEPTKLHPKPFFFAYPTKLDYRICFDEAFKIPEKKLGS